MLVEELALLAGEEKAGESKPNTRRLVDTNTKINYGIESLTETQIKKILTWVEKL